MFSHRRSTVLPLILVPVAALALSGCGTSAQGSGTVTEDLPAASSSAPGPETSEAPMQLVLRVDDVGGFTTAEFTMSRIPRLSVYSDGTVLRPGVMTLQYPGPMVPPIELTQFDPSQVQQLAEQGAQLLRSLPQDLGQPPIADAPTTVLTIIDGAQKLTAKAEALNAITDQAESGSAADQPSAGSEGAVDAIPDAGSIANGLSPEQVTARAALAAFIAQAESLPRPVTAPELYRPTSWLVWSQPATPGTTEPSPPPAQPWPGESLSPQTDLWSCQVARDDEGVTSAVTAAVSNQLWTAGGQTFSVVVQPLLPGVDPLCPV